MTLLKFIGLSNSKILTIMLNSFFKNFNYILCLFLLAGVTTLANAQVQQVIDSKGNRVSVENNTVTTSLVQPNNPVEGDVWFNSTTIPNSVFIWDGALWIRVLPASAQVLPLVTNYTLTPADNGNVLTFNRTSNPVATLTLTVPAGLPVGYNISIYQIGGDPVNIVGAAGVTINHRLNRFTTAGQDAAAGLLSTANNSYHLSGDLRL